MIRFVKSETAMSVYGNITDIDLFRLHLSPHKEIIIEGNLTLKRDCVFPCGLYIIGSLNAGNFSIEINGDLFTSGNISANEIKVKNLYNVERGNILCCCISVTDYLYNEGKISCVDIKANDLYNKGSVNAENISIHNKLKVENGKLKSLFVKYKTLETRNSETVIAWQMKKGALKK